MKIGERGGMVAIISGCSDHSLQNFPEVPRDPANGAINMNFSANILALDNAANSWFEGNERTAGNEQRNCIECANHVRF
jgi:hypothetical protein